MNRQMSFLGMAFLSTWLVVSASYSDAAQGRRPSTGGSAPSYAMLLSNFDSNRNGALDQSEVMVQVWNWLKKADANGNLQVTLAEYISAGGKA